MLLMYQLIVFSVINLGMSILNTEKPIGIILELTGKGNKDVLRRSLIQKCPKPSEDYFQSKSFKNFFLKYFHMLPDVIKSSNNAKKHEFKKHLKKWIKQNVDEIPWQV